MDRTLLIILILSILFLGYYVIRELSIISEASSEIRSNQDSTCQDSIILFLEFLNFFCMALLMYILTLVLTFCDLSESISSPSNKIRRYLYLFHSILLILLLLFLLIFSAVLSYYSNELCGEIKTVINAFGFFDPHTAIVEIILIVFAVPALATVTH